MLTLGLDTCLAACSVALCEGERVLAHATELLGRGHQERLAPMVAKVMGDAGAPFANLERIGVTVGPGSFTGLRVGIAFAKGLASALDIPAIGLGTLQALAAQGQGLVFAVIDARREQVYFQPFEAGRALAPPEALPIETAQVRMGTLAAGREAMLVGAVDLFAQSFPNFRRIPANGADARDVARIAARTAPAPLQPIYLRAPDARLPA